MTSCAQRRNVQAVLFRIAFVMIVLCLLAAIHANTLFGRWQQLVSDGTLHGLCSKIEISLFMVVLVRVCSAFKCMAFSLFPRSSIYLFWVRNYPTLASFWRMAISWTMLFLTLAILLLIFLPVPLVIDPLAVFAFRRNAVVPSAILGKFGIVFCLLAD